MTAAPSAPIAPLWPLPGETVWFRRPRNYRWQLGTCIMATSETVRVRTPVGHEVTVFRSWGDGRAGVRGTTPDQADMTDSGLAAHVNAMEGSR